MQAPDEFDRLWASWVRAVNAGPGGSRRSLGIAMAVVIAYGLGLVLPGRFLVYDMPMDALIPLDAVWRMHFGQMPHVDFHTPVGDLYYLIHHVAAGLAGADRPMVLPVTNAIVGLPFLGLAWLATRDRLPDPLRTITATTASIAAMSPRTLDDEWMVSFNAMYNRWGWILALIGLAAVLLEPLRERRRREWAEGALIAGLVLGLFWMKVTYLVLMCAGLALSLVTAPANRRLAVLGGGIGVALVAISALTPHGAAYLADLRLTAKTAADGGGLLRTALLSPTFYVNRTNILIAVGLAFAASRAARGDHAGMVGRAALAVLAIVGLSVLVASQNNDRTIPLLALAASIPVVTVTRWPGRERIVPFLALFPALMMLAPAWTDTRAVWTCMSTTEHRGYSTEATSPVGQILVPTIRAPGVPEEGQLGKVLDGTIDGVTYDNLKEPSWNIDGPVIVDDAVAMIRRAGLQDRRIASLTFSQIFPYFFRTEAPRGLLGWMDYGRTFGSTWDQYACDALADTEVVMQPKVWTIEHIGEEHAACLQAEFELADEDRLWKLWRRVRPHAAP